MFIIADFERIVKAEFHRFFYKSVPFCLDIACEIYYNVDNKT